MSVSKLEQRVGTGNFARYLGTCYLNNSMAAFGEFTVYLNHFDLLL
jgi:hypothetical protein